MIDKKKKAYVQLSNKLTELCDLLVTTVDTRNEHLAKTVVSEMDKCISKVKKEVRSVVNV